MENLKKLKSELETSHTEQQTLQQQIKSLSQSGDDKTKSLEESQKQVITIFFLSFNWTNFNFFISLTNFSFKNYNQVNIQVFMSTC